MPAVGMWQAGVAGARTIGVNPTSKFSAGRPLLVVGSLTVTITFTSNEKAQEGCILEKQKGWTEGPRGG